MNNQNLYDALEVCLTALEQGADIESCLARFPEFADELRPILEVASQARVASAVDTIPAEVARRGKARVLQAAAEMREQKRPQAFLPIGRRQFSLGRFFRLAAASLAMIAFLLTGGTGLVSASSGSIPGDQLYPVKRTWEGIRLFLAIDKNIRERLEDEFEDERVREINELFTEGRLEQVDFQGIVENNEGEIWVIGGLSVKVEHEANIDAEIIPGAFVRVIGETDDGIIKAEQISLILLPLETATARPTSTSFATPTATVEPTVNVDDKIQATVTPMPTLIPSGDNENINPADTPNPGDDNDSNNNGSDSDDTDSDDNTNVDGNSNSDDNSNSGNDNSDDNDNNDNNDNNNNG